MITDPSIAKLIEHLIIHGNQGELPDDISSILATPEDIARCKATIYIPDSSYWPEINRVYAACMGDHKPARAVIPCGDLHYGVLVEMEVIAATR